MSALPADLLCIIFQLLDAHQLSGIDMRHKLRLVCKSWRDVLNREEFQRSARVLLKPQDECGICNNEAQRHRLSSTLREAGILHQLQWRGHTTTACEPDGDLLINCRDAWQWRELRVLHLEDCCVDLPSCRYMFSPAGEGSAVEYAELEEIRLRPASITYSPERMVRRSEWLDWRQFESIVGVCPRLQVLDVVSGGSPFEEADFMQRMVDRLPQLRELTLFGTVFARSQHPSLVPLTNLQHLKKLTFFGQCCYERMLPLPEISSTVRHLTLEEFPLTEHAGRPLSALTTALPALTSVHMTLLRHSKLAPYRFPDVKVGEIRTDSVPAASASTGITVSVAGVVSMLGEMEEDHLQDIQKLQTFLTQPVSGGKQLTVQIEDVPIHHQRLQAPVPIRHI
mmetsp:Transcript_12441/g.37412  ORF Transcript_12441/g.37412 Transcript_12441/m.37412 type:complete len:396 (+) Transcript_12441:246-1433(+)|eukprot:CAMPEP_0206135730 /NCGR_PEP_ID=MMETSP1473-20131121/999_1 /ASSEMBLY_ACC=CAM_ASM_001109 /TAXON_ID=1461547 /ORGANISM="Stichococcus sp, Strain RCC1054" /LENGTH=395 /DNA_ID=CAMNT_0053527789 /DNA_START=223 /DNA_END=1410 /DNA_ORIENTATION=-